MIVALAQDVCTYIQEIDRLDRIKSDAQSISDTYASLQTVAAGLEQLMAYIHVLGQRLPEATRSEVRVFSNRTIPDIASSLRNFEQEPRQTKQLASVRARVQDAIKKVKSQWEQYAKEQIREPLELLKLVRNLPEVIAEEQRYNEITAQLNRYVQDPPATLEDLAAFDQNLQMLKQRLQNIEGLSFAVKTFLQRAADGQATIADLTDEVIAWCRHGGHAHIFAISFANR
jgi:DNA repair ATPase RecN